MNLQTNALIPVNNYSIFFSKTYVKITDHEFDKTENLLYMDIDQEIHRIWFDEVGVDETVIEELEIVSEEIETVDGDIIQTVPEDENDVDEDDTCSGCRLNGNVDMGIMECHPEKGEHKCVSGEKDDLVDTGESDVIQTVPEIPETIDSLMLTKEILSKKKAHLDEVIKTTGRLENKSIADLRYLEQCKIIVDALAGYVCDLDIMDVPKPVQPELSILKNNDQRKEFIDAYETWPTWIDQKETGERYYRYDFDNDTSFVVRVSLYHAYEHGKYSKVTTYGCEQYFLLGVKDKWISGIKTFHESSTNKSAMIDYLKEIQKK